MRKFKLSISLAALVATALLAGCVRPIVQPIIQPVERSPEPPAFALDLPLGEECEVSFRRDAVLNGVFLTTATTNPASGVPQYSAGNVSSVRGKILKFDSQWVVVGNGPIEHWVPRSMVLVIQVVRLHPRIPTTFPVGSADRSTPSVEQ